jgi:hypothetical protein
MSVTAWALLVVLLVGDAALIWFLIDVYRKDSK